MVIIVCQGRKFRLCIKCKVRQRLVAKIKQKNSKTLPFSEASAATTEMIKRRASIVWFVLVYCKRRPVGQLFYLYTIVLDKVLTLNVMLYIITREEPC